MQFFPNVPLKSVFTMIMDASAIEGSMKRAEKRDQVFGRLFGILSLFRSTRFQKEPPSEETRSIVQKCVEEVIGCYQQKQWLREVSVQTLVTILKFSHDDLIPVILSSCLPLYQESRPNGENEELLIPLSFTPASLQLILQVQLLLHGKQLEFTDETVRRTFVENAEVNPHHLKQLVSVYRDSAFAFPKIHPLWTVTVDYLKQFAEDWEESLLKWWEAITTQVLSMSAEIGG